MQHTLKLRAFFFNSKTDYLPYYKNFIIKIDEDATAKKILELIQQQNENFAYPDEKLIFKINNFVVDGSEKISNIISKLGTELQIDPVLSYRSNHGLIINDDDFMKSFALISEYTNKEDKIYYHSLYDVHYASETFKFSHDYIGDAVLLLAHKMISAGSEHKEQILTAISDPYDGLAACEYENNLFNAQFHAKAIEELNEMVEHTASSSFLDKISQKLSQKALHTFNKANIANVNVACYAADSSLQDEIEAKIALYHGNVISFGRATKLSGRSLLGKQDNLAYLKAATTLLDALDAGAELLVVVKKADFEMFTKHFAAIQKRIGREIPLPLVDYKTFLDLCIKEVETA